MYRKDFTDVLLYDIYLLDSFIIIIVYSVKSFLPENFFEVDNNIQNHMQDK